MSIQKKRGILVFVVGIFCLTGGTAALRSLKQQKTDNNIVVCYADFDRDGYPSQEIMTEFKKEGFTKCPASLITTRADGKFDSWEIEFPRHNWKTESSHYGKDD